MKIIHFSNWAVNKSGLFMCAAEQVKYERKFGIDSQMTITENETPKEDWVFDNWLRPISWDACKDADLFVIHRGLPGNLRDLKKPNIMVIHGTVEFLMLEEIFSHAENTLINTHINLIKDCDMNVAVNPHDYAIYKLYDPSNKLVLIPDAIDCEKYTIEGNKYPYSHPQILFCDSLRPNKYPSHIIWAMAEIVKKRPDVRLTVVGLDLLSILTWRNIILRSPKQHLAANIENIQLLSNDIPSYMRGASILVNGNMSGIYSRTELEGMACGCQVVGYGDFTKWTCKPFDTIDMANKILECLEYIDKDPIKARLEARQYILDNHNMEKTVKEKYIPLYEKVLSEKK
jgi:glycosyltransferase involved in cell wall biosynthesis